MDSAAVEAPFWGVTVAQVVAVASQATVHDPGAAERPVTNEIFDVEPQPAAEADVTPQFNQRINRSDVELWISRVGAWVSTALHTRVRLTVAARDEIQLAMGTVIELGAAAYLVDAAYPQRAGVNDNASYGDVLWTRYRQALADLSAALTSRVAAETTAPAASGRVRSSAPPAIFTDAWVRENTTNPLLHDIDDRRAPGEEIIHRGY